MPDRPSISMHESIRNDIQTKIISGEYAEGMRFDPEPLLAVQYSTSRTTIRQALTDLVAGGYIVRTKKRGTFVAPVGRHRKPGAWVAMVAADLFSYPVQMVSGSVKTSLDDWDLTLRLYSANNRREEMSRIVDQAVAEGAVGLLIYAPEDMTYNAKIHDLKRDGFPICLFDRPLNDVMTDCSMTDHVEGGYIATEHLLSLGHQRIGFVTDSSRALTYPVGARYAGYSSALFKAGIAVDPNLIVDGHAYDNSWEESLMELISLDSGPTGIFAINNNVATTAMQMATSLGKRVPDDLAVIGFDNSKVAGMLSTPLTTIEQPFDIIGRAAVRLLMERMEKQRTEISWAVLPPKLVVRESTAIQV